MRSALLLALGLAAVASGCRAPATGTGKPAPEARRKEPAGTYVREIRQYSIVAARGKGKVGYLLTYDVRRVPDEPVTMHFAEDLDNREIGWVSDDGQGERYDFLPERIAAARREPFDRVSLPKDSRENQVRRIFGLDPLAEIWIRPASMADVRRPEK